MYGPWARAMKRGVPPTARNARTGEFTPPGMTFWARSKSCALVLRLVDMARTFGWRAVVGFAFGAGLFVAFFTGRQGPEEAIRDHVAHAGAEARVQCLVEKRQGFADSGRQLGTGREQCSQ